MKTGEGRFGIRVMLEGIERGDDIDFETRVIIEKGHPILETGFFRGGSGVPEEGLLDIQADDMTSPGSRHREGIRAGAASVVQDAPTSEHRRIGGTQKRPQSSGGSAAFGMLLVFEGMKMLQEPILEACDDVVHVVLFRPIHVNAAS